MSSIQPGLCPGAGDASTCSAQTNQLRLPTAKPDPCAFCGQRGRLRCSRCKTWYCTVNCQENHWTRHRPICEVPPPLELPDGTLYDPRRGNTAVHPDGSLYDPRRGNTAVHPDGTLYDPRRGNTAVHPDGSLYGPRHVNVPGHVTAAGDTDSEPNSDDVMSLNKLSANNSGNTLTKSNINVAYNKTSDDPTLVGDKSVHLNTTLKTKEKETKIDVPTEVNVMSNYVNIPSEVASKALPKGELIDIVVPVEVFESPREFSIRIKSNEEALSKMMVKMVNDDGGGDKTKLRIGRNEVVACLHDHLWFRGVAISKSTNIFTVYLIDFGYTIKIAGGQLYPLKAEYKTIPAFNFQVCLAGIGPCGGSWSQEALSSFKEIVMASDGAMRLAIIFQGKVAGGRMGVSLVDIGEQYRTDVGNLLVELGLAVAKQEVWEEDQSDTESQNKNKPRLEERSLSESVSKKPANHDTKVSGEFRVQPDKQTEKHPETVPSQQSKGNQYLLQIVTKPAKPIADQKSIAQSAKVSIDQPANTDKGIDPRVTQTVHKKIQVDTKTEIEPVKSKEKSKSGKAENAIVQKDECVKKAEADKRQDKSTDLKLKSEVKSSRERDEKASSQTATKLRKVSGLDLNAPTSVSVTHVESPAEFYVVPKFDKEISQEILKETLEQPGGTLKAEPDMVCLACHEGVWHRAKIQKVSPDGSKVKVVFIDSGKSEKVAVSNLKTLTTGREVEGVAVKVKLAGVEPTGKAWAAQDVKKFEMIVDMGGKTNFTATAVGKNDAGDLLVKLVDDEKNDVGKMCFEVGICIKPNEDLHSPETLPISPISGIKKIELDKVKRKIESNENEIERMTGGDGKKLKFGIPTEVTVIYCTSPRDFSVLPSSQAEKRKEVICNTQVGDICLALQDGIWRRALVQKMSPDGKQAKVDIIDFGILGLKMKIGDLRELEGFVVRVGLAGLEEKEKNWGEHGVEMFKQVIDVEGATKFLVESVGDVDGVEMIKMIDLEGNDIAQMCVDLEIGVKIDEAFESSKPQLTEKDENVSKSKTIESKEKKDSEKTISTPLKASSNAKKIEPPPKVERVGEKPLSPKPKNKKSTKRDESALKSAPVDKTVKENSNNNHVPKPSQVEKKSQEFRKVPRGSLPVGSAVEAGVCFVESPGKFYVCPSASSDSFNEILVGCQDLPPGRVEPQPGMACLVFAEDCWHRAEVEKMSPSGKQIQAFLMDYGKTVKVSLDKIKPLDKFWDVPGLVCEVGLRGVKPAGEDWSKEEKDMFEMVVVDPDGGDLKFTTTPLGWNKDGSLMVDMVDMEGNNITQLVVDVGGFVQVEEDLKLTNVKEEAAIEKPPFPRTNLPYNTAVEAIVSHVESPDKMFLCPASGNDKFLEILENCQNAPSGKVKASTGVVCLAFAEEIYQRAEIVEMSSDSSTAKVFLLDNGKTVEVAAKELKPLDKFLDVPGLVAEAGLVNLGHGSDGWRNDAVENFKLVLDVGETSFMVTNVGTDEGGVVRVKMVDMEGSNITELSREIEVGVLVDHQLKPSK